MLDLTPLMLFDAVWYRYYQRLKQQPELSWQRPVNARGQKLAAG
jgi:hypothetical protein